MRSETPKNAPRKADQNHSIFQNILTHSFATFLLFAPILREFLPTYSNNFSIFYITEIKNNNVVAKKTTVRTAHLNVSCAITIFSTFLLIASKF